MKPVQGERIVF